MVKIGKKSFDGVVADVLMRYHGIDQEVADTGRCQLSVKALVSTVDRVDAFADLLKVKKQEALDTLVQVGFEKLCEADDALGHELHEKFLYFQERGDER